MFIWYIREDIRRKKRFLSGIARMRGGGVYPCPDFLAPFFYQVTVLKMAIFYSNFTVIVCFLVIFVIIIIKITKIIIIIIIETIIIIIKKNFGHTRKTSFLTSKKEDQVARIGVRGGGLGDSGNARKKTFFLFRCLPLFNKCASENLCCRGAQQVKYMTVGYL